MELKSRKTKFLGQIRSSLSIFNSTEASSFENDVWVAPHFPILNDIARGQLTVLHDFSNRNIPFDLFCNSLFKKGFGITPKVKVPLSTTIEARLNLVMKKIFGERAYLAI